MKRARGSFSLFVCFLNEFVLTFNSSPLDVQNLSFPTERSNLHLVIKALCKPRQAWAHFTLLTAEKLLRNHLGAGHAPSEREGRDAPDEFKYLSIGYTEVPQKTYFSLRGNKNMGEKKKKIKTIVSPCPSMHQHCCQQPALSWGTLSEVICHKRKKTKPIHTLPALLHPVYCQKQWLRETGDGHPQAVRGRCSSPDGI